MTLTKSAGAAPKPPTTTTALVEDVERLLRLSSKFLPGFEAHLRSPAPLERIAAELRTLRPFYVHDSTHENIEAWLRCFAGTR